MIFWIIILIGIGFGLYVGIDEEDELLGSIAGILVGGIIGFIVAVIICAIASSSIDKRHDIPLQSRQNLVALSDAEHQQSSASGAFVLAIGGFSSSSETKLSYAWYQRDENTGAITPHTGIQADEDTSIQFFYLEKDEKPYVEHHMINVVNETDNWVAPLDLSVADHYTEEHKETWELHIPRGSIVRHFKLDLK